MNETGETEQPPNKKSTVGRQILVTFIVAGVFTTLLVRYLLEATKIPEPPKLTLTSDVARGLDDLEIAQRAASAFVAALAAGNYDAAYAQMAKPYRDAATAAAFRAAWTGAPLLASPRSVKLGRAHSEATPGPEGGFIPSATFTARGVLTTVAGGLAASFTFLREGREARVLAVFVGGVPVVQGIGAQGH
jgi:hypothetical protein